MGWIPASADRATQRKIVQLGAPTLRSPWPVMNPLPAFTAAQNGATAITNGQFVNAITTGTTVNPLFRYPFGDIRRADWSGSAYSATYPDYLCVANFGVSNPSGGTTFTAGAYKDATAVAEFQFDGTQVEFYVKGKGQKYRVLVDEGTGWQYTTSGVGNINGTLVNDGGMYRILATFGARRVRNIRFEVVQGHFGGVMVGPNDTVSPCNRPLAPNCVALGDSITEPSGADFSMAGWSSVACQLLGWEASPSGSGGTGYLATGPTPRVKFRDRLQTDVINQAPQYVILAGGINDAAFTPDQIQTEATFLIQTIQQALPNTTIFVISNWFPRTPGSTEINIAAALKAAALATRVAFIDTQNGTSYTADGVQLVTPATGSWMTGNGNTGISLTPWAPNTAYAVNQTVTNSGNVYKCTTAGTSAASGGPTGTGVNIADNTAVWAYDRSAVGNSFMYTGTDTTHPVQVGHTYLGQRVAAEIYRILNWYGRYA